MRADVDGLTRSAHACLMEAVGVRQSTPPWWAVRRWSERRAKKRRYAELMAKARELAERASRW